MDQTLIGNERILRIFLASFRCNVLVLCAHTFSNVIISNRSESERMYQGQSAHFALLHVSQIAVNSRKS